MGRDTEISWTDSTLNPWWGCAKVAQGCTHCYADTLANRYGFKIWGENADRRFFGDKHWNEPRKWNRDAEKEGVRRRVFCGSMCDVAEDRHDLIEPRERLMKLIEECPWLDFQLLSKRPENYPRLFARWQRSGFPANAWAGASAAIQSEYERNIGYLRDVSAKTRFMSLEPLVGPIDCKGVSEVDWIIVGGESGHGARPMHSDWVRSIRDQCQAAGVAFFFKQWGEYGPGCVNMTTGERVFRHFENKQQWINKASTWVNGGICVDHRGKILARGGDFDDAEYPVEITHRQGKRDAGRKLDGREWNEMPTVKS